MDAIRFSSFGGYRWFSSYWWKDVLWYVTGLHLPGALPVTWGSPGWCRDIYTFYHRGRYGWAPRDTWSLDAYLNRVLAGSLTHLAEHTHGCPQEYFDASATDNECHRWNAELRRWALAFGEDPQDVDIYDHDNNYAAHKAEEDRRRANLHQALKEIEPMWEALWD